MSGTISKTLCEKCLQNKTEYLGANGRPGDPSNPWDCLNPNCAKDEQDILDLINPKVKDVTGIDNYDFSTRPNPCGEISLPVIAPFNYEPIIFIDTIHPDKEVPEISINLDNIRALGDKI